MGIRLQLIENNCILWLRIEKTWTPEEILNVKGEVRHIFEQADHTIHSLVDFRQTSVTIPLLTASQQVIGGTPLPNSGKIAVIGVSGMLQLIARPILALADRENTVTFFGSMDEAERYLRRFIP